MTTAFDYVRRLVGRCPLKKIEKSIDYAVFPSYAHSGEAPAHSNHAESMYVPVQSVYEWRTFAFFLVFIALILIGSQRAGSYRYVPLSFLIYIALIFILNRTKVSVGNGTLRMSMPFSRDIIISKNSISSMEILENIASRHKLRNLALLILMSLQMVFLLFTLKGPDLD